MPRDLHAIYCMSKVSGKTCHLQQRAAYIESGGMCWVGMIVYKVDLRLFQHLDWLGFLFCTAHSTA